MEEEKKLSEILPGEEAIIKELKVDVTMRRRLLDIGLIKNTKIKCIGKSPCGDPKAYLIRGAVIAIRQEDSSNIIVKKYKGEIYGINKKFCRN